MDKVRILPSPSPRSNLWFPALAGTIAIEHLGQMTDHVLIHCFIRPKLLSFADRAAHVPFLNVLDVLVKDWIPLIDEYHYCALSSFPPLALLRFSRVRLSVSFPNLHNPAFVHACVPIFVF